MRLIVIDSKGKVVGLGLPARKEIILMKHRERDEQGVL